MPAAAAAAKKFWKLYGHTRTAKAMQGTQKQQHFAAASACYCICLLAESSPDHTGCRQGCVRILKLAANNIMHWHRCPTHLCMIHVGTPIHLHPAAAAAATAAD
jgi:hypothetical protein